MPQSPSSPLEKLRSASDYFTTLLQRPENVSWLYEEDNLSRRYPLTILYSDIREVAQKSSDINELFRNYRKLKQKHFLRIGGRDLLQLADFQETVSQLTDFAQVCLQVGLERIAECPQWWLPRDSCSVWTSFWQKCRLVVLGLGKLGGRELNFVSDVDLVYLHQFIGNNPELRGQGKEFLRKFAQEMSNLLSKVVVGDIVFQVDLRLRPQGKDGELVPSMEGALDHYQTHGQAWERQALLKARPVAGVRNIGSAFLQELHPYIFRRFLDFQSLDEIKQMRDRILFEENQKRSKEEFYDLKLGVGGIREIEFFIQSFQLIYGGRCPELEEQNTLRCLDIIRRMDLLDSVVVNELKEAYIFLRRTEHWIQLDQNRRETKLPGSMDRKKKLSLALGYPDDVQAFEEALFELTNKVHIHFTALFKDRVQTSGSNGSNPEYKEDTGEDRLNSLLSQESQQVLDQVHEISKDFSPQVGAIVDDVLSQYLSLPEEDLVEYLGRVISFFRNVSKRPGLKTFVLTNSQHLSRVLHGLIKSSFVANLLLYQPGLIEVVFEESRSGKDSGLGNLKINESGLQPGAYQEELFERIRRQKNEQVFKYALKDIFGEIDRPSLTEHLSYLADSVLLYTYNALISSQDQTGELPLAIIGLGKLGSQELGFLSDLDLMFVFDPPSADLYSIPKGIISLCQRLIRLLSIPLQEGPGYPVDIQIRPTGTYGPLIVTKTRWKNYYKEQADIWEIQALLRSRALAGDMGLGRELEKYVRDICFQPRDPDHVWPRICQLRYRMESERSGEKNEQIHLKLGPGGLADLEFLVQGCQLIYGHHNEALQKRNTRQALPVALEILAIEPETRQFVYQAYITFRLLEARLQLLNNETEAKISPRLFQLLLDIGLWPPPEESGVFMVRSWAELLNIRRRVRSLWQWICVG